MNPIKSIRDKISILRKESLPVMEDHEDRYISGVATDEEGGEHLLMDNAKYALKGVPKDKILVALLKPFKRLMDKMISKYLGSIVPHEMPESKYCEFVKALRWGFDMLSAAEGQNQYKRRWQEYKRGLSFLLQNDDAYRFRAQWLFMKLFESKRKEIEMKAEDYYFARAKDFNWDVKELPKDFDEMIKKAFASGE